MESHNTTSTIPQTLNFLAISKAALACAPSLLAEWLPQGRREGHEYCALNPTRADSSLGSFKVNLNTGQWADFATDDKGGDLISLYAYLAKINQSEAARYLVDRTGTAQAPLTGKSFKVKNIREWTPITPVPDDAPPPPASHYQFGEPSAVWTYRNATGQALCHVYRFDAAPGKKEFTPLTYCCNDAGTTAWKWQALETPPPLYNLDKLEANPGAIVAICEGEKAADAAAILFPDMVTTTSLNGCKSPDKADWSSLAGRDCIIWPDNDLPGSTYAKNVTRILRKAGAARVLLVNPDAFGSGLETGWDAADALRDGWTADRIAELRKAGKLYTVPPTQQHLPIIDATAGELHNVIQQAEQAIIAADVPIFQRSGMLVRPTTLPAMTPIAGSTVAAGTLVIEPVSKAWLTESFNKSAIWRKYNERKESMVRTDCPQKYAEHYLAKKGEWNVRLLTGIIEAPTLRRDGSLLTTPGYDDQSGLYLDYTGKPVVVPDCPSREDALKALEVLKEPFKEFPFVGAVDMSVTLSAVLTAIVRRSLRTAPNHANDAPGAGTGKSLATDVCAMIATGRVATASTLGADEAETEKRLGALLMRGVPFINLDNAARPVEGDFLCSLATQETVDPRILGQSATMTIPTNTSIISFTGNNIVFKGDMTRRVLVCRMDPKCERPDARQFKRNLHDFVPANRHKLLSAALTVLRAFVVAGMPAHGKAPYGSFEEWDRLVRGALLWLGQADPLDSRERIADQDPAATGLSALMEAWFETFGNNKVTVNEVISAATSSPKDGSYTHPHGDELRQALLEVAGNRDGLSINPRTLSHYLRKNRDKISGNFRLEQQGSFGTRALWKVCSYAVTAVSTTQRGNFRSEVCEKKDTAKNIEGTKTNCSNCTNCTEPSAGTSNTTSDDGPPDQGPGYLDSLVAAEQASQRPPVVVPPTPPAPPAASVSKEARNLYRHMMENRLTGWLTFSELAKPMRLDSRRISELASELKLHGLVEIFSGSIRIAPQGVKSADRQEFDGPPKPPPADEFEEFAL